MGTTVTGSPGTVIYPRAGLRGRLAGALRRHDVLLRGGERGRAAQGRLLQRTPGRSADRVGPAGSPVCGASRSIFFGRFEGNKAEKHTILPIISQFRARHGIESFAVVADADAGMLSAAQPGRARHRRLQVHRRVTAHQGADRPRVCTSAGTETTSATGRSSTPSLPRPATTTTTTRPCSPNRRRTPRRTPRRGGPCGHTAQPRRPRHQDPDRSGEPRPRRHHRRQGRPYAPVRQDRQGPVRAR